MEDIYFFEVNAKYISWSVLKNRNFHECEARVYENFDVLNTRHEICWYLL